MKRFLLLAVILFSLRLVQAQIGINTENPLTLFHVDSAGDNSVSPTAAQLSNDVVITTSGSMGVGTLTPSVKLEIANTSGATPNLRIVDGSTMSAKVLESDADGVGRWTDQPPSYTKSYRASRFGQTFPYGALTLLATDSPIVIPQKGKYLLTLRWWGYNRVDRGGGVISGYVFAHLSGGGSLDQIEYYTVGTVNDVVTFTTSLYVGERAAGDVLLVYIAPLVGGASGDIQWQLISDTSRTDLMPQVILYSI